MPVASHNQKSHVAANFDCHDLWNAVVSLMMLLASHDAYSSANGIT